MSYRPRLVAFAGSARTDSFNKKLVKIAIAGAEAAGAEVTYVDLRELNLPIYDGDEEARNGIPSGAQKLKKLMVESDGMLIASPEYNSSISGLLKNAIDWVSRPQPGEPSLVAFRGKTAAIMSAAAGGLGGVRGLVHVRAILGNIGVIVLPDQVTIPAAHEAFTAEGKLIDAGKQAATEKLAADLVALTAKLKG